MVASCSAPPMSTPGQPQRFVWSMWKVPPLIASDVIDEVTGQPRTSGLPPMMRTLLSAKSPASPPPPPPGAGTGSGITGAEPVANANVFDHGPVVDASAARTRQ